MENSQFKPTILFFRHHPEALAGSTTLTSSMQSLETSFFLITLSRFPPALTASVTAIETAIQASDVGAKKDDTLQKLLEKAKTKYRKINEFPDDALVQLRKARNRFTHNGFSCTDDGEASSLIVEVALPFLWLCYTELHSFDAATELLPEYREQLDVAERVHSLAKGESGLDLSYCFNGFKHLIHWCLKRNFSSAWEIGSLINSEETGEAFSKKEEAKAFFERCFAAHWSFDCPICGEYQAVVCEIDTAKLVAHEVVPSRMACMHCGFAVRESQPFLSKIMLEKQLTVEQQSAILREYGIQ